MPAKRTEQSAVTYFVDRSLGSGDVPAALRAAGANVVVHDESYPQDASDEAWLLHAGKNEWVVLTKDKRIRHRSLEFAALKRAGVATFMLRAGRLTGPEQGEVLAKAMPAMSRWVAKYRVPFIAMVDRDSTLKARDPNPPIRRGGPKR